MDEDGQAHSRGRRIVTFLSFTAFLVLLYPCIIRPPLIDESASAQLLSGFTFYALIGMVAGGIIALAVTGLHPADSRRIIPLCALGIVLCLTGYAIRIISESFAVGTGLVQAGGFLFGAGSVPLCIIWSLLMGTDESRTIIIGASISCITAALANLLLSKASVSAQMVIEILLLLASCALPLYLALRGRLAFPSYETQPGATEDLDPSETAPSKGKRRTLGDLTSVLLSSTLALMLCALMADANMRENFFLEAYLPRSAFGFMLAALILIVVMLPRGKRMTLPKLYWSVFPAIAGLLLILDAFPMDSMVFQAGAVAVFVFYSALGILAVSILLVVVRKGEFPTPLLIGGSLMLLALAAIAGSLLAQTGLSVDDRGQLLLIVSTVFFVYLLLSPILQLWRELKTRPSADKTMLANDDSSDTLSEHCDALAQESGLTAREREILYYLGQGYSSTYIAKTLFISDNTVRTHFRSIYRKTGVSSKMELIDRLRGQRQGGR